MTIIVFHIGELVVHKGTDAYERIVIEKETMALCQIYTTISRL